MSTKKTKITNAPVQKKEAGQLIDFGGSTDDIFNNHMVRQVIDSLWLANSNENETDKLYQVAITALLGICPRNEMEGMLAAQMVACHNATMECYRRAMIENQSFEARKENLNQANKLSRTYTTLMESLNKKRGKGRQKVTVKHVHVHEGGQAVVGIIDQPTGGGDEK